jgi:hypothetical protein
MRFLADKRKGGLRIKLPDLLGGLVGGQSAADQKIMSGFHQTVSS